MDWFSGYRFQNYWTGLSGSGIQKILDDLVFQDMAFN
jgi:hypothetical protein